MPGRLRSAAVRLADRAPWLVDLYRWSRNPRWEAAIRRDTGEARRRLGWLRRLPEPPPGTPVVLLVMRREDVFDVKSSLMLGAALKLAGVRPVILAQHRRVPRIRRYARAFGVRDLRHRDEFPLTAGEREEIEARADELLARGDDFAAARGWSERGQPLGERALSTLIRRTLDGEPDLSHPELRRALRAILVEVSTNYRVAECALDAVDPAWVIADETGYATNGPLVDLALARGLEVLELTPYVREGALVFKRMSARLGRTATPSVSERTLERLEERPWTTADDETFEREIETRYGRRSSLRSMYQGETDSLDREQICRLLDLDPARPLVVIFSHVLWDASFFYGEDLFANYGEWLEETVRAAVANPRLQWLVKTHPANAFRIRHGDVSGPVAEVEVVRRSVDELPSHVRLLMPDTAISSLDLYRCADLGVTVRGTAGLEMACFGKPVVTGGSGHYSGLGFTRDAASREEYLALLAGAETLTTPLATAARNRARRYAYSLFHLRPWTGRSFEVRLDYPEQGWHPLDRNVVPVARTLAEARDFGDLHRWAEWVAESGEADYLEEEP